jgi:hypothetical protein
VLEQAPQHRQQFMRAAKPAARLFTDFLIEALKSG